MDVLISKLIKTEQFKIINFHQEAASFVAYKKSLIQVIEIFII